MPEYPRTPFRKVGTEIQPRVEDDELNMLGAYALQLQNIPDLAAKGAEYWFDGVDDDIEVAYSTKFAGLVDCGFSIVSFVNIQSLPVNEAAIINYSYFVGHTYGLFVNTGGVINMTIRGATTSKSVSGGVLELNRNYVIVGVYDPDADSRIHVNGDMTTTDMSGHGYSETARAIVIGHGGVWGSPAYLNCGTPKNLLFNIVLTKAEADAFSNDAPIPYKYLDASQDEKLTNPDFSSTWTGELPDGWSQVGTVDANSYLVKDDVNDRIQIYTDNTDNMGISQAILEIGKRYRYTVDIETLTSGVLILWSADTVATFTEAGIHTGEFTANIAAFNIQRLSGSNVNCILNSVSCVQVGCVAQYEQDGIGHNQWLDKSKNKLHGEVNGALPTNLSPSHKEQYPHLTSITDDTAWSDVVPPKYMLDYIVFEGENANDATINLGTTSGASDVFSQQVIAGSSITTVVINKLFSKTGTQSLYLNDDGIGTWNSASVLATLYMSKVEV